MRGVVRTGCAVLLWLLTAGEGWSAELTRREWTIGGVRREALLHLPDKVPDEGAPLVFGFHGHGGGMRQAAFSFRLHQHWPEAVVVYMQGLNTPGKTDPEGLKPGWQRTRGDQADRDLKFFDEVLASVRKEHRINARRIYSTGHSNGGAFTYLLWATHPDTFAAVAPSAAAGLRLHGEVRPLPCLQVAGEGDTIVSFPVQMLTMRSTRELNGCSNEGTEWAPGCTLYASDRGTPFVSFIHPHGHKYPAEAPPLIVRFFKEHARPQAAGDSPVPAADRS